LLERIRRYFDEHLAPATAAHSEASREQACRLATAALLVEMSRADHEVRVVERDAVARSVRKAFDLGAAETAELVALAEAEAAEATSLYDFTRLVNDGFDLPTKEHVVELLWRVAYADGHVDKYEEHLVRKIADLIHVSHGSFIRAKLAAEASVSPRDGDRL